MDLHRTDLDPTTPVLIGVGEASETLGSADYRARSEAHLAADALLAAIADTGADPDAVVAAVDAAAMTRSFEAMGFGSPLGTPASYPWAVLRRVGATPARVVHETLGGQTPQSLVNELCQAVADGMHEVAVVFGADVTSTTRHFTSADEAERPDFTEDATGPEVDRGRGTHLVNTRHLVLHGLINAPVQYALLEHARRHRLGLDRATYAKQMAALLAPLSEVAAEHPHSASPVVRTADEVGTAAPDNRVVADPYLRLMVARDQVNQGAACIIASVAAARRLGVPEDRWVFLHGHASLVERPMLERPDLSRSPATVAAVGHALDLAGVTFDEIGPMDLYSCFPIAITTVTDAFGHDGEDPRRLTVTGGLPFFGGAGSNYSLHGIAEVVRRVRADPAATGLVGANGGQLSKYAVGVYDARPRAWVPDDSAAHQTALDAAAGAEWTEVPDGPAVIETFSVEPRRDGSRTAVIVGRDLADRRFIAVCEDPELLDLLGDQDAEPIGRRVHVRRVGPRNRVALTRATLDRLHPVRPPRLDRDFTRIAVRAVGPRLEVALRRPLLDRVAHEEADEAVSAFLADPDLRVALLHSDGDDFCRGLDPAEIGWGHTLVTPPAGVAGLTGRATLDKPVVAAVSGASYDEGVEVLLACHVVVADETATFELTQPWRGLLAEHGGLRRLRQVVGRRTADEMVLTGRRLDAAEALACGLVSRVVDAGSHVEAARGVADRIASASPTALRATLRLAVEETRPGRSSPAVDEVTFSDDLMGRSRRS